MMISKAIEFALKAHCFQVRKGTDTPYVVHPIEAGLIIAQDVQDEDIICAGILHDTIEDTKVTKEEITDLFNDRVARIVVAQSEDKSKSWKERKAHTIEFLKNKASNDVRIASCADKLSNIRSLERDLENIGDKLWDRFNAPYEDQKWYYTNLVDGYESISDLVMYKEFVTRVGKVFGESINEF